MISKNASYTRSNDIGIVKLSEHDIARHHLVKHIIDAYSKSKNKDILGIQIYFTSFLILIKKQNCKENAVMPG